MDSPPTSSLTFWTGSGEEIQAPEDWSECWVRVPVAVDLVQGVRVLRQGQDLPVSVRKVGEEWIVAGQWSRAGTGHYSVEASCGLDTWQTTVTITPTKITSTAYRTMLRELQSDLPAAVAISFQRMGALTGIEILPPEESTVESELLRLRRAVIGSTRPGLLTVLPAIAEDPYVQFVNEELWVERNQVRRLRPQGLVAALAKPNNLDEDHQIIRAPDSRVVHTADVYENRLLALFCRQVELRLRRVIGVLALRSSEGLDEAESLLRDLTRARRRASFLDTVRMPSALSARVTMVLLKRPAYRAMFEGYLELHRSAAVRFEDPALDAPLENLPSLYQLWGTMRVIQATLGVGAELGFTLVRQNLVRRDPQGLFVRILPDGRSSLELRHAETAVKLVLTPERSFGTSATRHLRSVSFPQKPDVVVEINHRGERTALVLFDPKYKLESELVAPVAADLGDELDDDGSGPQLEGKPKKIDIDKMHAYRDAIRDLGDHRVVDYAAIVYPGPLAKYGGGVAALPGYPGAAELLTSEVGEVIRQRLRRPP